MQIARTVPIWNSTINNTKTHDMKRKLSSVRGLGSAVSALAVAVIGLAPGPANAAEHTSDKYLEFRDPAYYDRGD
jgi:hypothetical protein